MNIEAYRITFGSLGLSESVEYHVNGQLAINRVNNLIRDCKETDGRMPIAALLLDYQMPGANGLEVVEHVREAYSELNRGKPDHE